MEEISSEISNKYAILIDSENVSAKYIESIFDELSRLGSITVRKIYGDWSKNNNGWDKDCLLSYSIQPVQQFSYTAGKNSTDSAMIIDAMDLLYTSNIDGFCLVTSDSDFTQGGGQAGHRNGRTQDSESVRECVYKLQDP